MRVITPAMLFIALIAGCLDEDPPRPRPQPTDQDGKDDSDTGGLVPDEEPVPEDGTCGEDQKPGDGDNCLPP
jgi:hypothetical protein